LNDIERELWHNSRLLRENLFKYPRKTLHLDEIAEAIAPWRRTRRAERSSL
jgi:hypothetical protein